MGTRKKYVADSKGGAVNQKKEPVMVNNPKKESGIVARAGSSLWESANDGFRSISDSLLESMGAKRLDDSRDGTTNDSTTKKQSGQSDSTSYETGTHETPPIKDTDIVSDSTDSVKNEGEKPANTGDIKQQFPIQEAKKPSIANERINKKQFNLNVLKSKLYLN